MPEKTNIDMTVLNGDLSIQKAIEIARKHGYDVKVLNLNDLHNSATFNPNCVDQDSK